MKVWKELLFGRTILPGSTRSRSLQMSAVLVGRLLSTPENRSTSRSPWRGGCNLASIFNVTRPNVTIDGRFAPGEGFWFYGKRGRSSASNFVAIDLMHLGNDPAGNDESDCWAAGVYSTSLSSTTEVTDLHFRRALFAHGADELIGLTVRDNGMATGNTLKRLSFEDCVLTNPVNTRNHAFGPIVGDGVSEVTFHRTLFSNLLARYPYAKHYASKVEVINCAMNNGKENQGEVEQDASVHFINCDFHKGPRSVGTFRPIRCQNANGLIYHTGCVVTAATDHSTIAGAQIFFESSSEPGATASASPLFTGSGIAPVAASTLKDILYDLMVQRTHGGAPRAFSSARTNEYLDNSGVLDIYPGPYGPLPTPVGASYPAANAAGVPLDYLEIYPDRTDPEAIIAAGPWSGMMVAEHIGAWLTSSHYAS